MTAALMIHALSTAELAEAADENFVTHFSWAPQRTNGMYVVGDHHLLLIDSGLPCDTFNVIGRARLTEQTAAMRIQETLAYFRGVERPFAWWVSPADQPANLEELLIAAGLSAAETELAMAIDLHAIQAQDQHPAGLEIRRVQTADELQDFAQIMAANWNPPDEQVLAYYARTADSILAPNSPYWFYVGYYDGQAVATAELTVGGGVVGLYNILTLEAYRQRGFGTALTLRPLLDARGAGYGIGVLQAAAMGANLYRRLGFQEFGGITEYKLAS